MINIAILDNTAYGLRLSGYLNKHSYGQFLCFCVDSVERLTELAQKHPLKLILYCEQDSLGQELGSLAASEEPLAWLKDVTLLSLTEHKEHGKGTLFRYYSGQQMVKELQQYVPESYEGTGDSPNIAVLSFGDGVGLRSQVMQVAHSDNKLFWELVAFSDWSEKEKAERLLYAIKMRQENLLQPEEEALFSVGSGYVITGISNCFDYRELEREDVTWFFQRVKESSLSGVMALVDLAVIGQVDVLSCFDELWILEDDLLKDRSESLNLFLEVSACAKGTIKKIGKDEWRNEYLNNSI